MAVINKRFTISLVTIAKYVITPWCRGLPGKLTGPQLLKKFPALYATRRFITAFTKPDACPYPKPDRHSPCLPNPLLEDQF